MTQTKIKLSLSLATLALTLTTLTAGCIDPEDGPVDDFTEDERDALFDDVHMMDLEEADGGPFLSADEVIHLDPSEIEVINESKLIDGPRDISMPPTAWVGCTGVDCDGMDPVESNCSAYAETISDYYMIDMLGANAHVTQRYSWACKTRWTRIERTFGSMQSYVRLYRSDNGELDSVRFPPTGYLDSRVNYTDMLYCPRSTCEARSLGYVSGYYGVFSPWID